MSLAGCSEEGEFSGGDSNNDSGSSSDLELLSHNMNFEQGEYTSELKVVGQAENVSGGELDYAEVEVKFLNDGAVEETSLDNINGLGAGQKWNFEVLYLGQNPEVISDYQIRAGTSL